MEYENNINHAMHVGLPRDGDVDFYAEPENYAGGSFAAMQRLIGVQGNTPRNHTNTTCHQEHEERPVTCLSRLTEGRESRITEYIEHGSAQRPQTSSVDHYKSDRPADGGLPGSNEPRTPVKVALVFPQIVKAVSIEYREARDRFRHSIRIVLILLKWISSLSEKGDDDGGGDAGRTFTDIASDAFTSDEMRNAGLSFDVSQFKAKREVNISNEVKMILSTPTVARNAEQLQSVLYGLQHLKSFAEYPLHMQEKLCRVAWFQHVPAKRVIIRQGHFAENFYFILAGQAVVRILDKHPKSGETQLRTATIMRKGMSFGELALLHHSRRTATVVSQDPVQLLAVGRDDFFDIFMSGQGPDGIPEHIKYACSIDVMRDWPIQRLVEHPECCLFHFFKRGVVIVKDSAQSDWLYIVKSGSCQVMKELKGVPSKVEPRTKSASHQMVVKLPKLGTGEIRSRIDTGRRSNNSARTPSPIRRARTEYDSFVAKQNDVFFDHDGPGAKAKDIVPPIGQALSTTHRPSTQPGYSRSKFNRVPTAKPAHMAPSVFSSRTTTPRQSSAKSRSSVDAESEAGVPEELRGPVFVQVDVLKPKDIFGLTSIQFDEDVETVQTSVSLVSNGAECIMLSKKFFAEHATEKVKKNLRHTVRPYPSEDTLQENLQTKVHWDLYKKKLIKDFVVHKQKRKQTMTH